MLPRALLAFTPTRAASVLSPLKAGFLVLLLATLGVVSCSTAMKSPREAAGVEPPRDPVDTLASRGLLIPVQGYTRAQLRDNFDEVRGGGKRRHSALDIMAPRGTPVVAVDDGRVAKLLDNKYGGLTVYQFDRDARHAYYYAHLDAYAKGLVEGATVRRGQVLGYVGSTGNAPPHAPHLHFAIFRLGPERKWWKGMPVNPYPLLLDATHPHG
jgi:murein DD-endopeptidase MepM/ murein hydrolase activator NlpD